MLTGHTLYQGCRQNKISVGERLSNEPTFRSNARGVAILFGKDVESSIHKKVIDEGGNFIMLDITISKQRLNLINLYKPNEDYPMFLQNLSNHIDIINKEKKYFMWRLLLYTISSHRLLYMPSAKGPRHTDIITEK